MSAKKKQHICNVLYLDLDSVGISLIFEYSFTSLVVICDHAL